MSPLHRAIACLLGSLAIGMVSPEAHADKAEDSAGEVRKTRKDSRTILSSSAWLPKAGEVNLALGLDQEQRPTGSASVGLGDLAEVGLVLQPGRSVCDPCEDVNSDSSLVNVSSAFFKMGTREGLGHEHLPAFALVFQKSLLRRAQVLTDAERILSKAQRETLGAVLTATASKTLGPAAVHIGAELLVAEGGEGQPDFGVGSAVVRPALAVQWTPTKYPLSTFMVDLRWVPTFSSEDQPEPWRARMTGAWGVRYQALEWASVDLNVRGQEGQGLGDALVTLGVRGSFDLVPETRRSGP